jgi:hyaluronan synthase
LDGYLNETFFGRRVEFSDDSMLALYARHRGRTAQQPSAFAFTLMPETFDQHKRQYMRWMRGAFIRSWWRFRYLPMSSYAYWGHLVAWVQMALSSVIFIALFVVWPIQQEQYLAAWPYLLAVPVLIGYGQSLRYLTVRRNDQSTVSQVVTFLLSPVATIYAFTVLRFMRWWAMMTPLKTGWGTRENVEVRLSGVAVPRCQRDLTPVLHEEFAAASYWNEPTIMLPVVRAAGDSPSVAPPDWPMPSTVVVRR